MMKAAQSIEEVRQGLIAVRSAPLSNPVAPTLAQQRAQLDPKRDTKNAARCAASPH
jgi:hypothetical protein